MVDAGFIAEDGKITPKAKEEFIRQVKQEMKEGSSSALFSAGISLNGDPSFNLPLEDEKKFPAFHKNSIKNYENMATTFNTKGNFSLLPAIADPLATIAVLKPDLKVDLNFLKGDFVPYLTPPLVPQLATLLEVPPVDLAPKLSALVKTPPVLEVPEVEFANPLQFPELFSTQQPVLKIPSVMPELILKIPGLALKIAKLDLPAVFVDLSLPLVTKVFDLPKLPPSGPSAIALKIAVMNVTIRMTTVMAASSAVGVTLGSSPVGLVGGIGRFWGVK